MIDQEKVYEFEVEISAPMERKKKFVALRLQAGSGGIFDSGLGSYQGKKEELIVISCYFL